MSRRHDRASSVSGDIAQQLQFPLDKQTRVMIARVIRLLDQQREALDRRIARLIESDNDWRNERELLTNAGSIQAAVAKKLAEGRYDEFDAKRRAADAAAADQADIAALETISAEFSNKDTKR